MTWSSKLVRGATMVNNQLLRSIRAKCNLRGVPGNTVKPQQDTCKWGVINGTRMTVVPASNPLLQRTDILCCTIGICIHHSFAMSTRTGRFGVYEAVGVTMFGFFMGTEASFSISSKYGRHSLFLLHAHLFLGRGVNC